MDVHLREIPADNFVEAIRLRARLDQENFVASNVASIAPSKLHTFLECCGIYDGDGRVGFSACGVNLDDGTVWIVRPTVAGSAKGRGRVEKDRGVSSSSYGRCLFPGPSSSTPRRRTKQPWPSTKAKVS